MPISGILKSMPELRKDPVVGRWVIIAEDRGRRPHDFDADVPLRPNRLCPFCEGNEGATPGEILAVREKGTDKDAPGWRVRVVPNKYPALVSEGDAEPQSSGFFESIAGVGAHEVIVESPRHLVSLTDLTEEEACEVFSVYRDRLLDLSKDPRLVYGLVFKNAGAAAGASIEHVHTQLIATPILPITIQEELDGSKQFSERHDRCIWCDMIGRERQAGDRIVEASEHYVAFCPYASRFPYETWVMPIGHETHFEQTPTGRLCELARLVRHVIGQIEAALDRPAYNYLIHTGPFDSVPLGHYHWHIEIFPRLTKTAGFEWGTGYYINPVVPEKAAETLRCAESVPVRKTS